MPWAVPAAMIGGSVISGVMGGNAAAAQRAQAAAAAEAAVKHYLSVNVPDPEQQKVILQKYQSTGQLDPQMEQAIAQQQSELNGMQIDPTSRAAEVSALTKMQDVASNGGLDAQAKQQEQQALNSSNANEAGQRGAIMQNFAARGQGGSGAQLAAELSAEQGDANSGAMAGMNSAASAQQRALQAMTAGSQMAGTLNSQDYNQAAQAASAQDAINRFNTQNSQSVSNANTGISNQAAADNLRNSQNLANANVDQTNKQEVQNKGVYQQQFDNQYKLATGEANAEAGVANTANAAADATSKQWAGVGSAVSQGAGAYGQYSNNQNNGNQMNAFANDPQKKSTASMNDSDPYTQS